MVRPRLWFVLGLFVARAGTALAQPALEHSVVRHRLVSVHGRWEAWVDVATALQPQLVQNNPLSVALGYNISESWAVEARAGYDFSEHTGLANHLAQDLLERDPNGPNGQVTVADDLSSLWEMKANGLLGVRWEPIYGKVSLLTDATLHFKVYLWLGGGWAMLHRQSVVYCTDVVDETNGVCGSWLTQNRSAPLLSGALGIRFFTGRWGAIRLELRDIAFKDSYLVNIDRTVAEAGGATGQPDASPGFEHVVLLGLGVGFFL